MIDRDGEVLCLGDVVEVDEDPEQFEAERAQIVKVGKHKVKVRFLGFGIKPEKQWVKPQDCILLEREI
jgi:hypothetical protein